MGAQQTGMTIHDVLAAKVYLPEFLKQCSRRGVTPRTQEEVAGLLNIAQNIRLFETKQAEAGIVAQREPSQIEKAASASSQLLGNAGTDPAVYLQDPEVIAALQAGGIGV